MRPHTNPISVGVSIDPSSPDIVKMFESCVSALVQAINIQRQGNVSKLRVGDSSFASSESQTEPAHRQRSFLEVCLWGLVFVRS